MTLHPYTVFKVLVRTLSVALLLCAFSPSASTQGVELDDFSVFQYEDEVYLSWIIAKGNSCNGISIERSSDNIHFSEIDNIQGVCGSPSAPQPYSFIDQHPIHNEVNFYRLELGLQGYSETRSIEYLYIENNGFQIKPNPAVDRVRLIFQNTNGREHALSIYSLRGEKILDQSTNNGFFDLDVSNIPQGVYPVTITNIYTKKAVTQRLVIQ